MRKCEKNWLYLYLLLINTINISNSQVSPSQKIIFNGYFIIQTQIRHQSVQEIVAEGKHLL